MNVSQDMGTELASSDESQEGHLLRCCTEIDSEFIPYVQARIPTWVSRGEARSVMHADPQPAPAKPVCMKCVHPRFQLCTAPLSCKWILFAEQMLTPFYANG